MKDSFFDLKRITPDQVKFSQKWLNKKIEDFSKQKIQPSNVLRNSSVQMVSNIVPGKMYLYEYDPKYKDSLPYYDRYPLVLPFARDKEQFTGLNLHYLNYEMRLRLFKELLNISGVKHLDETTKIKYSWSMVKSASKMRVAQPCIKMYLFEHLASPLGLISPEDWYTALMLPVQRFVGASKEQVWAQSRKFR